MANLLKSKWGKWTDLTIGKVHEHVYLLQYRRHKNGKVQFRVEISKSVWGGEIPTLDMLQDETP